MAFDVETIRAEFPILGRQIHGKPLVYLDSAASAQKPRAVIQAMTSVMENGYANVHRGLYTLANEVTEAFEKSRDSVAKFLNADTSEIVFTKGATEGINLVASGLGQSLVAGDEIVLTEMEHHANIVPWHFLRERLGVVLKFVPVLDDGQLDLDAYQAMLGPRTRVVGLSHMSNVLGTVNPVRDMISMAHSVGAICLIDGCQAVVHLEVDVKALDADFYVFSGHKLYGPTGVGVLYGKSERLNALPPYQGGGEMISQVSLDKITYADPPHRFEAGTPPIVEVIGLGVAIAWLSQFDRAVVQAHEHALYARLLAGVSGMNSLSILGEAPGKGAIMSFNLAGAHAHDVAQILDRYGVAVRAGSHCAEPLMSRFGVTSSARASFAIYNTEGDVDAFIDALDRTQSFFS